MRLLLAAIIALTGCVAAEPVPDAYYADEAYPPGPPPGQQPSADGEWLYTAQYGWVFMPYDTRYVSGPSAYLFFPSYGWRWSRAPWVMGYGRRPYFSRGWDGFARRGHHWARPMARAPERYGGRHR